MRHASIAKRRYKALVVMILIFCLDISCAISITVYDNELVFDLGNAPSGNIVLGFGANLWSGDPFIPALAQDLHFKFARIFYGGVNPPTIVTNYTWGDFDALYAGLTRSVTIDALLAMNVSIIVTPGIPSAWINATKALSPDHVQSLAMLDGALIDAMARFNETPAFIEPFNEPDGDWSGHVPPSEYNAFITMLRGELDARGFHSVGIDGPGLAHVDLGDGDQYVDALDASGVASLGAWSLHGYEWNNETRNDPAMVRFAFANGFMKSVRARDPALEKPVIMSEYSTFAFTNASKEPDSESIPFAIRVLENSLSFLNGGANALIYWQAHDQSWDPTNTYSFLRLGGAGRPVYYAIKTLYPVIPTGARDVPIDHQPYGSYASVFVASNCTILALVNHLDTRQVISVKANGMDGLHLIDAIRFVNGAIENDSVSMDITSIVMPPLSTLTLIFS